MAIGFMDRLTLALWNLLTSFVGYPTCLPWLFFVLYFHKKNIYILFTIIWIAYFSYTVYLLWTDAAKDSLEAKMNGGDTTSTVDAYYMHIVILAVYIVIGVMGCLKPDKVGTYRETARGYARRRF
jgi:hypothetical protein